MRITAAIVLVWAGLGVPAPGLADEAAATFEARWPETSMRQPTTIEAARLIAVSLKDDLKPVIKDRLSAQQRPIRCAGDFCDLLTSR